MKRLNLDKIVERKGSCCTKYDAIDDQCSGVSDVIPMWIADMDFETPDFVINAVQKRLDHKVLGYSFPPDEYYEVLQKWFERQYGFRPEREELCYTPGIVSGIYKVIQCLTHEGDGIVICPPVYHPFAQVIRGSRRRIVEAPLLLCGERYEIDWEALEKALSSGARLLIWCHPHNPGGRVWTLEELRKVAHLAHKHGVRVISDEIHADLCFRGYRHIPFPTVSDEAKEVALSFMAPSKAFNMPGLIASQLYIPNKELRTEIFDYLETNCLNHGSATTYGAVVAAYKEGGEWLDQVIEYIESNVRYVREYLQEHLPALKMIEPEASFLIFLDCRALGFKSGQELSDFFVKEAKLFLNDGTMFGTGGEGFMRLNVGVPRSVLEEAMSRLKKAVDKL